MCSDFANYLIARQLDKVFEGPKIVNKELKIGDQIKMRIKMPAVRIAQADADSAAEGGGSPTPGVPADTLTCGACRRAFALADIVRFIQHKISSCDKDLTSYHCYSAGPNSDPEDGSRPGQVTSASRRPSLLTARRPPSSRVHTPPLASPSIAPPDLIEDGGASSTPKRLLDDPDAEASTPKRRASTSPLSSSSPEEDIKPKIKQEHMDTSASPGDQKKSRTEVADAESNTMQSEPNNYVCSTCKARVHSAWRLLQHAQHVHGVKIYMENASQHPPNKQNHSSSSTSSSSSGCSSTGPPLPPPSLRHHPLLPPPDMHSPFGVGGLLRMPLPGSLPPLAHPSVPQAPLFARPNHHDHRFRMEQLVSEQFRHHGLNLAAAAAAVAANSLPPHQPFPSPADRPPNIPTSVSGRDRAPPASQPLSLEPQLDFYSQRLRQLAGTTSPGAATGNSSSPSPRKHSPPFASPSPSRVGQTPPVGAGPGTAEAAQVVRPHSRSPPERRTEPPAADTAPPERPNSTPPAKRNDEVHTCDICSKKFRFENNLIVHRRIHTGEKPFKCSECDEAFERASKLKRHMKVHRAPDANCEDRDSAGDSGDDDSEDELDDEELDGEEEDENEDGDDVEEAEDLTVSNSSAPSAPPRKGPMIPAHPPTASLVGELMDKFGLSNIAQYSEAYKQALQESGNSLKWQLAKDRDNNNGPPNEKPNGLPPTAALRLKEEFAKLPPQPHPLFNPFENPFEASKRMKLEMERGEGWWLPTLHAQRPPENIFDGLKNSTNGLLQNPLLKSKDSRRNDTCEYCGKVFKNCSNLTVHRRSHTGEKPYKCELCSYACAQSSKLTRHMKTHGRLGKDVYRCRFCEMPFSVPSTLEKHMRKCVVNQSNGAPLALSDDSNACRDEAS